MVVAVVGVVVEWFTIFKENFFSEGLTPAKKKSCVVGKMCVFVSRPIKIDTLHRENGDTAKLVVGFLWEKTFPKNNRNRQRFRR